MINDINVLVLGASTVSGALNVTTTGGAITQSGPLTVAGVTTLAAGANDIRLTNALNNFSTVGITSGNIVMLTDANALMMNMSTASAHISISANDLTIGGAVASTDGTLNLTGANTVTQLANLTANGANNVTVTTTTGSITMAPAATTTSGTGAISYTAGTDVTLGSLTTAGAVNVIANGGSVLSATGSGTNVTAGANSTLQAFNGVVGTQAAPVTVNVNPGTLSVRATARAIPPCFPESACRPGASVLTAPADGEDLELSAPKESGYSDSLPFSCLHGRPPDQQRHEYRPEDGQGRHGHPQIEAQAERPNSCSA